MRPRSRFAAILLSSLMLAIPTGLSAGRQDRPAQPPSQPQPAAQPPAQQPPPQQPPAQQTPPDQPPQRPQFRTGINFVSVDVIVTDKKGNPVLDLKPEDFEVKEDGKPQKVETFDLVKIDATTQPAEAVGAIRNDDDAAREASRPDTRLFIVLLDDYHTRRGNDMAVRQPLMNFVENQLGPRDMVALMYPLTPVTTLSFTRDHAGVAKAIETFQGRKFDYTPRNEFEERYAYYPTSVVEQLRNQIVMDALKGAAVKLGTLREGRKSIIWVSEGFLSKLPAQLSNPVASLPGFGNPYATAPGVDAPANASQDFFNSSDLNSQLQEVYDTANRNNTSIYAVDPRGLAVNEFDINEGVSAGSDRAALTSSIDVLRVLADNTDGRAIVNRNDLGKGMQQIIRDMSGYYLIGYTSAAAPTDGKFHKIEVKVKRPGVDVRARKGYWAYTMEDVAKATAPPKPEAPAAVTNALNDISEPVRGRSAQFWVGTERGADGRSRVTFAWERVPPGPGERRETSDEPVGVMLTAVARDGRPIFRGRVPDAPERANGDGAAAPSTSPSTSGASTSFDVPPGPIELRMVVEGDRGQVVDSTTRDLTVPDFTKVQVAISTPRVYRTRNALELRQIKADPAARPTADRSFSRNERLLIRFDAYAPGTDVPAVTAKVLNREGKPMADVPVQSAAGQPSTIDLPLSAFAAGDYLVEITAKTASGTAQQLVAFNVGS